MTDLKPKTLADAVAAVESDDSPRVDDMMRAAKVFQTDLWWCPRCRDYYGAADAVAHAEKHRGVARSVRPWLDLPPCPACRKAATSLTQPPKGLSCLDCDHGWQGTDAEVAKVLAADAAWDAEEKRQELEAEEKRKFDLAKAGKWW